MYSMVTGYIHYTLYISYPWLILIIIGGSCLNGCGLLPTWTIEKDANLQLEISENVEVIFFPFISKFLNFILISQIKNSESASCTVIEYLCAPQ